ncbi:SusC/RagA family TonB-linked outer membrane protein [Sediminibacterium soli]|uniref:SusC/RagA family TonB-linked outer membrane protein n=1 Tax=Sediminibacterium soli TaxID=2698829 RepID=UPI00137A80ED|nr:SusC/RagA family TonB-linked outer membrane protein [Sediminibacterium soli]NCI45404.1 SusC/RagA family TonB-linked outer membrane protein [Sediminibacterium soli]
MKTTCLKVCMLLTCFITAATVLAQTRRISGKVVSTEDSQPVAGVNVFLKGKTAGTQTGAEGAFSIDASPSDILVFSYVGYLSQEIPVAAQTSLQVSLRPDAAKLADVVVIGYGTQTRRNLTAAVSTVSPQAFEHSPSSNVATALQGTVPGLRVQQSTGQPGTSPSIVFRGGTDFGGNGTPLFVVDGVIVPTLFGLDMNDIASIDLLKDAASTAIYGARAANGVVLVSTKRGKKGRSQVTYSVGHTTNYIRRNASEYLSAADYIRMNRIGIRSRYLGDSLDNNTNAMNTDRSQLLGSWGWALNSGWTGAAGLYSTQLVSGTNRKYLTDPAWKLLIDENPFAPGQKDSILYRELDVRTRENLILQRNTSTEHSVGFSGANEQGDFALSLGTVNDQGMIIGSSLKRWNVNFNGGLNVGKKLRLTTNISAYTVNQALPYTDPMGGGAGGLMQRFIGVAPTVRYTNDTSGVMLPGPNDITLGNPLYWSTLFVNTTNQQRFMGGVNLEYSILPSLKFLVSGSGYFLYTTNNFFTKAFQQGNNGAFNNNRSASFNQTKDIQFTTNAFLQFNKNFNGHNLTVLGGGEFYDFKRYVLSGFAQGAPTDLIPWLSASTSPSVINGTIVNPAGASSNFSAWERLASLIGRVNYHYKNRYLLTGIVRYDGSSRLNSANFYGLFPGISAGWNLSNEDFFLKSSLSRYISLVKPRISYGVNGNLSSLGYFATAQIYNNAGVYNGQGGTYAASYINPDLRWERSNTLNMGADLGFLQNRINVSFDYFIRNVYDKIASLGISAQTGFTGYTTNLAQLQNRGIELGINAQVLVPRKADGLSVTVGATLSTAKTYAVKLPYNGLPGNRQGTFQVWDPKNPGQLLQVSGLIEGQRSGLDEVWVPRYAGIYTAQADLAKDAAVYNSFLPYTNKRIKQLGDARWEQTYRNDTIDSRQFVYVGRTTPQVVGSFYLNTGWKGWHLYAGFDYALGFVVLNNEIARGLNQVQGSQNSTIDVLKTWAPSNPNGTLPRYYWANQGRNFATDASGNNVPANMWEKGDYLSLRELTLSYDLSQNLITGALKNKIKSIQVYLTGSNLTYFTRYSGNFPEVGGVDNGKYPLPRRFTIGAKLTL